MLAQALIAEADAFVALWKDVKLPDGRERVVRHGQGPERMIQTGIGPVAVRRAKLRDRGASERGGEDPFHLVDPAEVGAADEEPRCPAADPLSARGLDGRFPGGTRGAAGQGCAEPVAGGDRPADGGVAGGLCAWQRRDLSARRYVYVWADGVYLQARMEPQAECMLVLIGATPEGKKELVGFQVGVRESAQSWRELLVDLKARGLAIAPELAIGDGALGFWKALDEVFPTTRHQRCWVHKTANVLNKLPAPSRPT